jgi:polyhydroxybutyrate depolymerase
VRPSAIALWLVCSLLGACKTSAGGVVKPSAGDASLQETTWEAPGFAARPYRIVAPASSGAPLPVLVALHGFGGSGADLAQYFGLSQVAAKHAMLLVLVDGTPNPDGPRFWNAGTACCDLYAQGPDDVAYLDAVLDDVARRFAVDAKRVYLVGHSNGGFMAYRYACERAERVAAIVSLAGTGDGNVAQCHLAEPVAVLHIHGDADQIVPFAGGDFASPELTATLLRNGFPVPRGGMHTAPFAGARAMVDAWAAQDGCSSAVDRSAPAVDLEARIAGAETEVTRHTGCRGGAAELWTIRGGAHIPTPRQPSWGEAIYAFLEAHPKP